MKTYFRKPATLLVAAAMLAMPSCKEETDPLDDNIWLTSANREITMTKDNVIAILNLIKTVYPDVEQLIPQVTGGVIVYSITYNTTFMGEEVAASGLIAVPSVPGTYPVLAYQNGTNTLHSAAPSVFPDALEYKLVECMASTGYVVVFADYLGFGASEDMAHPYLHKESTVQTLVDMLRALEEFDEDIAREIESENEYYLLGYSQGGWATLALLEALENEYAADFMVKGASCGAGPYDLSYFNSYVLGLTEYPMPVFLGYIASAYKEYDLFTNSLSDIFDASYASVIPSLYDGLHTAEQINDELTIYISELFQPAYVSGYSSSAEYQSVRDAMAANSIDGWQTEVPLLFVHGTADDYVPPILSERMRTAMLTAGSSNVTCSYIELQDINHNDGAVPAGVAGLGFFRALR